MNAAVATLLAALLIGASPQTPDRAWERFEAAFAAEDAPGAIVAAERLIEREPSDAHARFALVRAHAMAGDVGASEEALREALSHGFVDFHRLTRDAVFARLRETDLYAWLLENWRERQDTRSEKEARALADALGPGYAVRVLEEHRVRLVTALDDGLTGFAIEELDRVARFGAGLFPEAEVARPDPWVLVILPTPEHAHRLLPRPDADGVYDHARKGLVVRDIGPALRHEFFHALHWRHMERLGQTHPVWIREGLATLVEDVDVRDDELTVLPSWRTNTARRLAEIRRLRPWPDFVSLSPRRFLSTRPVSNYAQARALVHWLRERGLLGAWYRAYTAGFDEDHEGLAAVRSVVGESDDGWDEDLRAWLLEQEEVGAPGGFRPVGLGIRLRPGPGGPVIDQTGVLSDDGVRLRLRDEIRAVEDVPVRSVKELYRELGGFAPGDGVRLTLDRAGEAITARMTLVREDFLTGLR